MRVAFLTLGCRVNQAESAIIKGTLEESGATIVNVKDNPDYCIVNTCTVTSKSDYNSRQLIRRAAKAGAKVIVTGCYSQLKPDAVKSIPGVTAVIDIRRKNEIIHEISGNNIELSFGRQGRSRPYLKVQDGCNFGCSYCAVPLARGRSRSISPDEAIRTARAIESGGFNEIVLTGVHLGTYGHDLGSNINLAVLLKKLLVETSISRIRLSSIAANEIDDGLMELLQEKRVCNHLHLPLQSGSDKILKLMGRTYTRAAFTQGIAKIASRIDNIALGSDVIVGFPGEEMADFSETFNLLRDLPFSYLHVFPFSPREKTAAAEMNNRPPHSAVADRVSCMRELHEELRGRYMLKQLGRDLDVILEDEVGANRIAGTSGNYLKVVMKSRGEKKGSLVFVRVAAVTGDTIEAVPLH